MGHNTVLSADLQQIYSTNKLISFGKTVCTRKLIWKMHYYFWSIFPQWFSPKGSCRVPDVLQEHGHAYKRIDMVMQ